MYAARALRACLALCLLAGSQQISIKEFSVPEAVQLGEDAELRCRYELASDEKEAAVYVKWWWSPQSDTMDDPTLIYQHIIGQAPQTPETEDAGQIDIKQNDTIVLKNVTPASSGAYQCEVYNIEEIRQYSTLTVFSEGTGPSVNTSIYKGAANESARILIECEAEKVAPRPELIISVNGNIMKTNEYVKQVDGEEFFDTYASTALSLEDNEEKEIRCELTYKNNKLPHQPYVDTMIYVPPGRDAPSSTDATLEDATETKATPETLLNPSDDGIQVTSSWVLLIIAALLTLLQLQ